MPVHQSRNSPSTLYQRLYRKQWGFKESTQKFVVQHSSEVYYSVLRAAKWKALMGSHRKASNPKVRATDLVAIIVYTTRSVH